MRRLAAAAAACCVIAGVTACDPDGVTISSGSDTVTVAPLTSSTAASSEEAEASESTTTSTTPSRSQTATRSSTTTQPDTQSSEYDSHGFVNGPRCSGGERLQLILQTDEGSQVVICKKGGALRFKGWIIENDETTNWEIGNIVKASNAYAAETKRDGDVSVSPDRGFIVTFKGGDRGLTLTTWDGEVNVVDSEQSPALLKHFA